MKMLAWPIWENYKAHKKTDPTSYGYHIKPVLRYLQHVVNPVARHRDQVECQEEYHHPIVIVLLYVWEKPHVRRPRPFVRI